ncbi:manganese efflux pump MntP family protein [Barnesiella propionica]|uniref:manganese efflux pump MntP n=1 Tax=Barnesiella propionica TaxID=2981781 RepID=UPI0011C9C6A3|nr:manganese efflux pump MntP family protein [Barnesiella propionica]MCU6768295.1 manganese efflux pump MntP family protein [Barnesiella propionica]
MNLLEIIMIAIGLSMDSFAVSITGGVVMKKFPVRRAMKIAFFLSVFQAVMPLLGWLLGSSFRQYIVDYDHWVAFAVLLFLGGRMAYEGLQKKEGNDLCCFDPSGTRTLLGLSLATSIDALAVGISFAFLNISMTVPTLIILITTFCLSFTGIYIGRYCGRNLQHTAEVFGGIVLILIGVKILIEHLYFS